MATAQCSIAQLTTCLLDCAESSDFMRRRQIAVVDFCRQGAEGLLCLGLFNEWDGVFHLYAPTFCSLSGMP